MLKSYCYSITLQTLITLTLCLSGCAAKNTTELLREYDDALCVQAQRTLINADSDFSLTPMPIRVQTGEGEGFHTIQMSTEPENNRIVIATTAKEITINNKSMRAYVGCKMVNRDRVNDQLQLTLSGPTTSCQTVNLASYYFALELLDEKQRQRFLTEGKPLEFIADTITPTGGQWLPADAADYIDGSGNSVRVSAPSVQVPWNTQEREFYQGTHHCKLLSAELIHHWMTSASFKERSILSKKQQACSLPKATNDFSCLFYFAPAQTMFCQDYTGSQWTEQTAREACAKRHASPEALKAAASRYEGKGGVFESRNCAARQAIESTCVFHCNDSDENMWHDVGSTSDKPLPVSAAMMSKACDLYIDYEPPNRN